MTFCHVSQVSSRRTLIGDSTLENQFWASTMPMYYFQLESGPSITQDAEGSELSDLPAARLYAVQCARELLANAIRWDRSVPDRVFVVDGDGRELLTVFMAEVLPPSLKKTLR